MWYDKYLKSEIYRFSNDYCNYDTKLTCILCGKPVCSGNPTDNSWTELEVHVECRSSVMEHFKQHRFELALQEE